MIIPGQNTKDNMLVGAGMAYSHGCLTFLFFVVVVVNIYRILNFPTGQIGNDDFISSIKENSISQLTIAILLGLPCVVLPWNQSVSCSNYFFIWWKLVTASQSAEN